MIITILLVCAGLLHFVVLPERYKAFPISAYLYAIAGAAQIFLGIFLLFNTTQFLQGVILGLNIFFLAIWTVMQSPLAKKLHISTEPLRCVVLLRKVLEGIIVIILFRIIF